MGKFHVGDRWADDDGDEWLVFATSDDRTTCRAVLLGEKFVNAEFRTDGKCITDGWTLFLTRLISSERWIPFAEMMPETPRASKKRVVVAYVEDEEDPYLFCARNGQWIASDEIAEWSLSELTPDGAHWRYLTPPEAS